MHLSAIKNLIWIQTSFLGDVILSTAAFNLARKEFPEAKHWLITTPIGKAALSGQPFFDGIITFDKRKDGLLGMYQVKRGLKKKGALDSAVILQPHKSFRSSLLARFLAVPRVTYEETAAKVGAWQRVPRVAVLHEAARIGLLLEPLGIRRELIVQQKPFLEVIASVPDASKRLNEFSGRLVGIAPGSVWATKRWSSEGFADVAQRLLGLSDVGVVLLGSRDEQEAAQAILNRNGDHPRLFNLVGLTGLADLPAIYEKLDLLVTNDSSPIHYASALNVPTVAIFGATVPAMGFGPLASESVVVQHTDLPCRPCSDHGPQVCPLGHFRCMRDITADQVFDACQPLLLRS